MELQLFGINHKTSDVSEREKFIINESNQILLDSHLKNIFNNKLESFFGISTCNRTEFYFFGESGISSDIFEEVMTVLGNDDLEKDNFYFLNKHDALVHMCKVASGIDSQVLGEQEILGQFKNALKIAQEINIVSGKLLTLSNKVLEISKKARTKTEIGLNSLSVSGLAYKLVKNIFEEPKDQNILIVGAGSLAHSVMENLFKNGINKIKSVNRSVKKIKLDNDYEVISSSLDSLHDELEYADIVIASSTTELPLVGKGAVENALKKRKYKPILLIDLGVPRNIEDEIRNIEQAYLFSIDDIEKITQENYGQRSIEAEKAMNIIVIEAHTALDAISIKDSKDKINIQLEEFLNNLSSNEINQFKDSKDFSGLISSIKTMNIESDKFNDFKDIKKLDDHIVESMIKRFIENA
ncbi:MAG: glutamyl-tRNA reductase [Gammaproteobacteria bacterium]